MAKRLTSLTSPAGTFSYAYDALCATLPAKLTLPSGEFTTNTYDNVARLLSTVLKRSDRSTINSHSYQLNAANQRTQQVFTAGNYVNYTYDSNGNLTNDGRRSFSYDDDNQLVSVIVTNGVGSSTRSDFAYDAKMRRRIRTECTWSGSAWVTNAVILYAYDGNLVIQERNANNLPTVGYTRGRDLGGSLEGAGGIGGLLARTDLSTLNPQLSTAFYHADGSGNITCLISPNQVVVAHYLYDPYGNLLSQSGPLADANLYRFSSKELHVASGLVYYLYRFYDSNLQRWPNRDPLGELGFEALRQGRANVLGDGPNLYAFVRNNGVSLVDPFGLAPQDADDIIIVLPELINMARRRLFACWCLDSVSATLCRCINLTSRSGMAECLCLTAPDPDCKKKIEDALKAHGL
jgi:RHS repeat-associated protein